MTDTRSWSTGEPCERHGLGYCTDCRDMAGMRMQEDGTVAYRGDCAVKTFVEITGADYDEAAAALRAAGFAAGAGTPADGLTKAFTAFGYTATRVDMDPEFARALSGTGRRVFFVQGYKGRKGHAWSLVGGVANRAYSGGYRYSIFEVTA